MVTSERQRSGKPYDTAEDGIQVTWISVAYSKHMGSLAHIRALANLAWKSARIALPGKTGVLAQARNVQVRAEPIVSCLDDDDMRRDPGLTGRRSVTTALRQEDVRRGPVNEYCNLVVSP